MRPASFFLAVCQGLWVVSHQPAAYPVFELRGERVIVTVNDTVIEATAVVRGDLFRLEDVCLTRRPRDWYNVARHGDNIRRFLAFRRNGIDLRIRTFNESVVRLLVEKDTELTLARPVQTDASESLWMSSRRKE